MQKAFEFITSALFRFCILSCIIVPLSACGGGGGSGTSSDELPLELGLDGPGDVGNYFPLAEGNFWHFQGTEFSQDAPRDYQNSMAINGTKIVDGVVTLVLQESNAYGEGSYESYIAKDLNGIANLGTNDFDVFGAQLSHYWEGRFPLVPGESFVQIDRSGLNFGEDLDGDGSNETVDIRSVVTIIGFTSITVPVGTFENAVHIQRNMTMDVHLSSNRSVVPVTATEDSVFAQDIGWLDRTLSISMSGTSIGANEVLTAYHVNDQSSGVIEVSGTVIDGQGTSAGINTYYLFNVDPGENLTIALTGLTDNADLFPIIPSTCNHTHNLLPVTAPEDCQTTTTGNQLIVAVNALESSEYTLSLAATPSIASPVSEGTWQAPVAMTPNIPTTGQVETRGTSYYSSTGLTLGTHTVSISGLSGDADLHVYSDETFSWELDCTLRASGDVVSNPEDCRVENTSALYFSVDSGELNRDGASYIILTK